MRATLHDHAPNTYYGQWPRENAVVFSLESLAIAHEELNASAGFVIFDVPARDSPGNRSPARWKFVCRPKENLRASLRHPVVEVPVEGEAVAELVGLPSYAEPL